MSFVIHVYIKRPLLPFPMQTNEIMLDVLNVRLQADLNWTDYASES